LADYHVAWAVLNLLPVTPLVGRRSGLSTSGGAVKGKSVSERTQLFGQQVGIALLVAVDEHGFL